MPHVCVQVGYFNCLLGMSSEDFQKLMDAIQALTVSMEEKFAASTANMKEKFAVQQSQLDRLQQDVATTAASSSQDVMTKLNKWAYQFKRKGNEAQFTFNKLVGKQIDAAKRQLDHITRQLGRS